MNSKPGTTPEYDFFVSYARADDATGWISRFVEDLLAEHRTFSSGRELQAFFDRHATTTGADWQLYLAGRLSELSGLSPSDRELLLADDDALELLEKHRPFDSDEERTAARRIVQRLGGFTLAVELVAAFLAAHVESTDYTRLADCLGLDDLVETGEGADVELCRHNHERRLNAVLGPVLESLSPAERRALEYATLLPPDCLPLPWLRALVAADFPELDQPGRLIDPWSEIWRRLENLAIFTRPEEEEAEPKLMLVHRLVQELTRRGLAVEGLAVCQQAIDALVQQRAAALNQVSQWQEARWEVESLEALAWLWAEPAAILPDGAASLAPTFPPTRMLPGSSTRRATSSTSSLSGRSRVADAPRACHRRAELREGPSQSRQRPQQFGVVASGHQPAGRGRTALPPCSRNLRYESWRFSPKHASGGGQLPPSLASDGQAGRRDPRRSGGFGRAMGLVKQRFSELLSASPVEERISMGITDRINEVDTRGPG